MPALIAAGAVLLRQLVIVIVQTGLFIAAEKVITGILDRLERHHQEELGLDPADAKLATENIFIQILIYAGITLALVRSRLPLKIADRIGLSSKGLTPRKLSPAGEAKIKGKSTLPGAKKVVDMTVSTEAAAVVAKSRGLNLGSVQSLFNNILKVTAVSTGVFFAAAQYIDFANWQGPYQKTFQKLLSVVGINPDTPLPKAGAVSDDVWKRIYTVVETLKPAGISMPYGGVDRVYSRQALVDVVNEVASHMVAEGTQPTFKNVMAIVIPLLQQPSNFAGVDNLPDYVAPVSSGTSKPASQATTIQTPKVFTGVVSQGVVQSGLVFEERQDDLIESVEEMRQAAANNLTPYLRSLPGRVTYELKVVSSVTTKDGFRQTGTTQKIQTGTYSNGTPKYKSVTNKFAVLDVFILSDRGTRTKLTSIVLGPTNSAKLTVQSNDLRALETSLPSLVTTTDPGIINNLPTGTTYTPQTPVAGEVSEMATYVPDDVDTGFRFYSFTVNGEEYIDVIPWAGNIPTGYTMLTRNEYVAKQNSMLAANPARWQPYFADIARRNPTAFTTGKSGYVIRDGVPFIVANVSGSGTAPAVGGSGSTSGNAGANAQTLSEWYQARGQALPSVSARAIKYQELGLGQSSYYTGTAEQNTKLLNALKNT